MANGLSIQSKEFSKLTAREQNVILYQNTEQIKNTLSKFHDAFEEHTQDDKFHFKIIYWVIGILAVLFGVGKFTGFM